MCIACHKTFCSFRLINSIDLNVLRFTNYGKNFPKSQNTSPDAFIQLACQLAYYKYVYYIYYMISSPVTFDLISFKITDILIFFTS